MKMASGKIVATLGLLALMTVACNFAQAQGKVKPGSTPVAVEPQANTAQLQATADQAAARIQASPAEKDALIKAVRANNTEELRSLLLKNGFTPGQLGAIKINPKDTTGGHGAPAQKIKITIRVSCCPLTITITLSL